ncbi:MAG: polysaccharide biosynthesis protein [Clostridia bacterium]|nr:polysaccharide biosynthesis protein [Clostridia bacterium]
MLLKYKRKFLLVLIDLLIILSVFLFAFLLEAISEGGMSAADALRAYALNFGVAAAFVFLARLIFGVYSNVWKYANASAYLDVVVSDVSGGFGLLVVAYLLPRRFFLGGWQTVALVAMLCCVTLTSRFVYQWIQKQHSAERADATDNRTVAAIVGAGRVGALLADELLYYKRSRYRPVFFVDNNDYKVGSRISGLPVYGNDEDIFDRITEHGVQEILIAIPTLTGDEAEDLLDFYSRSGCKVKLYAASQFEDASGNPVGKRVIRDFKIEDLLFRDSIKLTEGETSGFYEGKTVLVTGGGGSIGSELCRQIAKCSPKRLIIFDIYENNAYEIEQELIRKYGPSLGLSVEIGSVRDRARLNAVFNHYRPDIVFHAAAHKHVPLMEHSNAEAIKNNCLGTYNTADMAEKYGVKNFTLISTDKAVNPTNVMGASKRMCEMIVQCRTDSKTVFSAVRFGNVLGSNGSVIPLFKHQIANGGPITITDKRIIRYFMTIPEASGLVMQAGAMAKSGDLFVLDMGKPIRIYDLAHNMIKLSGLRPDIDIEIIETGLRPGEKLYEELLIKTEELDKTDNDLIFIEHDKPLSRAEVDEKLERLKAVVELAKDNIADPEITRVMKEVVPTFFSPEEVNRTAEKTEEMQRAMAAD